MGTLLSSTPLRSGMTEGRLLRVRRGGLWSTYGVREAARCLVIPPPNHHHHRHPSTPRPFLPTLSSPPPHHDKPDLLSIKEPQATSPCRPPSLLSYPAVLIPFVIYAVSVLVSSKGHAVAARLGRGFGGWLAKERPLVPPVATFRKPFNGFRHIC